MQQASTTQTTIRTGVYDVAEQYRAMIKPEMEQGIRISNPLMWKYAQATHDGSFILDAPCGTGCYALTLANMGKDFHIAVSDAWDSMLNYATTRLHDAGYTIDSHLAKLDKLTQKRDWENKFDLAFVPNIASELFEDMPESAYEEHIISSLQGIKSVLKEDGIALVDARDWETILQQQWTKTNRANEHNGTLYYGHYNWQLGQDVNSVHVANTRFWNAVDGIENGKSNIIRFAGRSIEQLKKLFNEAGFEVIETAHEMRGNNCEPFITFALKVA